jgi:hypothetical protein
MGLMDKMKEQAAVALNKAQQGVSQGKAKIDEAQARHQWDALLRNLGAAVYAEQREGGSSDAVTAAVAALDAQAARVQAETGPGSSGGFGGGTSSDGRDVANGQGSGPAPAGAGVATADTGPGEAASSSGAGETAPSEKASSETAPSETALGETGPGVAADGGAGEAAPPTGG